MQKAVLKPVSYACMRCEDYKCNIADCPKSRAYKEAKQAEVQP